MSEVRARRQRMAPPPPASQVEHALERMLARLRDTLRERGRHDAAERLARSITGLADELPDGGVLGLPFAPLQPVDRLVSALSLGPTDTDVLALALLSHRYDDVAAVFRKLSPNGRAWPTIGLAAEMAAAGRISGVGSWTELQGTLASSPLMAAGLLIPDGSGPMSERTLRPADLLWEALCGLGGWPHGISVDALPAPVTGLDRWYEIPVVATSITALRAGTAHAFCAASDSPEKASARLAALVRVAGLRPVILRTPVLTSDVVQQVLALAVCRDLVPVFCESDDAPAAELIAPYVGLPLLVARASGALTTWPRPLVSIPMNALSLPDRESALSAALDGTGVGSLTPPATAEPRDLELAAGDLLGHLTLARDTTASDSRGLFLAALDRRTQGALPPGGHLTHPRRSWDSLVLTDDRTALLREAVDRAGIQALWEAEGVRADDRRGERGLRLLFTGPPGTGKTLAAEVMAHALGRDLLGVNLARLVSKWIGETEKNLEVVFDAAERGDLLLFFDEADALFAKRSEVADARDRYANLETAYLLGRIEAFDGVVVLSTNLRRNIDSAFARRLEFIVPFDMPDADARRRLWEMHAPPWVDLSDDVDLAELAGLYDLSGALIRNAMAAAAFLAVSDQGAGPHATGPPVVTTRHLVHAVEREHSKAGLAFPGPPHRLRLADAMAATAASHAPASRPVRGRSHEQGRQS